MSKTPPSRLVLVPEDAAWLAAAVERAAAAPVDPLSASSRLFDLAEELAAEALDPYRDLLPDGVHDEVLADLTLFALADADTSRLLEELLPGATQGSHERVRGSGEPVQQERDDELGTGGRR